MSSTALQALIGTALIDHEFCKGLLNARRLTLLTQFDLTDKEREILSTIKANSIYTFAVNLHERLTDQKRPVYLPLTPGEDTRREHPRKELSDTEGFLIECLAWGLLRAYGIENPPVPVREMIRHPLRIFERLALVELNLGLYDAAYRSCLNGSRLIVVDPTRPDVVQCAGMARELYVAFCRSPRAAELHWIGREHPHDSSDLFARCLLMPAAWVRLACAEITSLESLAVRFGVPIQTMTRRLSEVSHHRRRTGLEALTEALFSLKEPWRGRFLDLVAKRATNKARDGQLPTRDEVTTWLSGNPGLYQDVRYMLNAWQKPGRELAH